MYFSAMYRLHWYCWALLCWGHQTRLVWS